MSFRDVYMKKDGKICESDKIQTSNMSARSFKTYINECKIPVK